MLGFMFVFSCSPSCSSSPAWLSVELEASSHLWVERVLSSSISVRGVAWNLPSSQLIAPRKARTNICSSEKRCLESKKSRIYVIGIDEAQFFDDLYEFCRKAADDDGKTVIVSGLDGNT
ncbi:hypothetical protein VIGAN_07059300 [Vigna angularis var. angularis]|uniref:Thymidine kinase n=1 Tax=Vigna angularis var. angularis TaxID=157739 RepID=A0A0S3SGM7_PHAAN|nr:hypothetical protein VIGAN_07059300 [Vigna angularis var. angularis]